MKKALFALTALAMTACANKVSKSQKPVDVVGLCSPIKLQYQSTTLDLQDYFLQPERIDSIQFPESLSWHYDVLAPTKVLIEGNLDQAYGLFTAYSGNQRFDIPIKRSTRFAYTYEFDPGDKEYDNVQIRGSFNAWNQNADTFYLQDGVYKVDLVLQPESYEYLLVLDGVESLDPSNNERINNGQGGYNSVLRLVDESPDPTHVRTSVFTENGFALYLEGYSEGNQHLIVLWQNELVEPTETTGDTILYAIPADASAMQRSFIRAYAGNESKFGNDLLIPLEHGSIITQFTDLTRNDWEAASMYFLMIDRFKNGNQDNDSTVQDSLIHPLVNFFGGDIAGVTQAIEAGYFDSLGVNTVWISPVTQNPWNAWGYWDKGGVKTKFSGYHGYWPISNVLPDKRFASETELRNFLEIAHADGKNVLLDYVANHVHQDHPIYQNNKDWATNLYLPDGTLNTERWDDHRLTTWFDTFMPTLDLRRPEIVDPMTDSALIWITDYDFDGFRHDATKHIDELYWRALTLKTKEQIAKPKNKRIYQIGETYGSPELIASYISTGMLDAQFDFNLYDTQIATLLGENGSYERVAEVLSSSLEWYGHHHLMGNISGNQDRGRFISYASGDVSLREDAKLAGWTRDIGKPNSDAYNRLALLHAFNFAIPGIPVIYYGDEYGMPGANDPDNRRMMKFEGLDEQEFGLKKTVSELIKLRSTNMALLYGSTDMRVLNDDVMVIRRQYFDQYVWFIYNKSDEIVEVPFDAFDFSKSSNLEEGPVGDLLMTIGDDGKMNIAVNPNSFGVLLTVNEK